MEIGVYTFADLGKHPVSGVQISAEQRMKNLLEEVKLADEIGLDVFGLGEHHRPDYLVSSPSVVLAAAAVLTKKIKLTSAVTVLSSEDPVRVFQQYASVDLLSGGRAEIMAGRGSFIESFPLFGYNLKDYDELFAEKLELLLKLGESEVINWQGRFTQTIEGRGVYPRPVNKLPVWIAVGGTPESVIRAAKLGLPLAIAIIGGQPFRFAPLVELYKKTYREAGHDLNKMQLSINSHVFIAEDGKDARDIMFAPYADMMGRIGRERGWPPLTRQQFDVSTSSQGALLVGDPEEVIDKILYEHELFGNTRFLAQMSMGAMPHDKVMKAIELLGTVVAPAVRKAINN